MNYEKPLPGNPNELTIRQHVIPVRTLERFAGDNGCVQVSSIKASNTLTLRPTNRFFTLARVWDQRAEAGWMKQIEDHFQTLANDILSGHPEFIVGKDAWTVAHYFSLWYWRSRQMPQIETEFLAKGVVGTSLTLEEEERLEKNHYLFMRTGGRMPSRFLTGMSLQMRVDQYAHQIKNWTWGVIQAQAGEFLMPDVPSHGFIPVTPKVVFAANHPNGTILKSNLKKINTAFLAYTWQYFVARNIKTAMAGISSHDILKAVKARDAQIAAGEVLQGPIAAAADHFRPPAAD